MIRLAGEPDDPKSTGAMHAAGVKELEISFYQSVERAMKELSRWGAACESAWNKKMIEKSATAPAKPAAKAKPAKKAAKKR